MNTISYKNILLFFFFCSLNFYAQKEVPILKEIVTDNANIFTSSEKEILKNKLLDFEQQTSSQIVVVTIKSLNGETIEGFALDVFNKNKLGQKKLDNGLLILFSDLDKKVRIEVGYGLESTITDALASRIIREIMIPNFKKGQKFEGIDEASSKIIELINNPETIDEFIKNTEEDDESEVTLFGKILGSIFLTPILFLLGIFGYNKIFAKNNIYKKINVSSLYKKDKNMFFSVLLLGIFIVGYLIKYFSILFFGLFIIGFLSVFVIVGFKIILKEAYNNLKTVFKALFTGKLGIIIFPFYLPFIILFFIAGILFTCVPIFMLSLFFIKEDISSFEPIYFLYAFIILLIVFIIISILSAISEISEKRKKYALTLFNNEVRTFNSFGGRSSGRSYSSSGSSYSSSSSSSSFSGGGGSSGGGGASGSW